MTEDSEQTVKESGRSGVTSDRKTMSSLNKSTTQRKERTRESAQNRVVVRHLPPTMTSEQFLEAISPIPEHNDYYFCRSDPSLGVFGYCRSYINFIHTEDLIIFKDKFDGYVFVDSKGNEFSAIVEFAPFQRIPRRRIGTNGQPIAAKKRDNKCGTIEQDSDYIEFLETLEAMKNEAIMPSAEVYLEEIEARDKQMRANHGVIKMSTPLIEFIKNKRIEKNRLREERREERKRQQLEQKKLREEEQMRKIKLLKQKEDNKKHKEVETKDKDKEKYSKREEERVKIESKDSDKRDRNESKTYESSKKFDSKRIEKRSSLSGRRKSEKPKESNNSSKENNESTFVVKVVHNSDKDKTHEQNANSSDGNKSETNTEVKSQEIAGRKEEVLSDEKVKDIDEPESSSKGLSESLAKIEARRIRNKDRPTREIYRPGATKRERSGEGSQTQSNSGSHKTNSSKSETLSTGYKQRIFTRSKQ